jgi:hypothetical protein
MLFASADELWLELLVLDVLPFGSGFTSLLASCEVARLSPIIPYPSPELSIPDLS